MARRGATSSHRRSSRRIWRRSRQPASRSASSALMGGNPRRAELRRCRRLRALGGRPARGSWLEGTLLRADGTDRSAGFPRARGASRARRPRTRAREPLAHAPGVHGSSPARTGPRGVATKPGDPWRAARSRSRRGISAGRVPSRTVVECAAEAGYRVLMTSEPTSRISRRNDLQCVGRYAIWATTPAARAAAYVRGARIPRAQLWLGWNVKKLAKRASSPLYERLRSARSRRL